MELAIHININMREAIKMKLDHNSEKYAASKIKDAKYGNDFYMDQKIMSRKEGK